MGNPTLPRLEILLSPSINLLSMKFKNIFIERFCEDIGDLLFSADRMHR